MHSKIQTKNAKGMIIDIATICYKAKGKSKKTASQVI